MFYVFLSAVSSLGVRVHQGTVSCAMAQTSAVCNMKLMTEEVLDIENEMLCDLVYVMTPVLAIDAKATEHVFQRNR